MEQINELTNKRKIIFSKKIMLELMQLGFNPVETMPNPTNNRFLCWSFEWTPEFDDALCKVLGGEHRG